MEEIVKSLIEKNKTISTMESCTGGGVANEITNIPGASNILKFSAVTYSTEHKIKMGVPKKTIDKYTVYSNETAKDMSKAISDYTNSDYGVGITGQLDDINNKAYISVYDKENNKYITKIVEKKNTKRKEMKRIIINEIINILHSII